MRTEEKENLKESDEMRKNIKVSEGGSKGERRIRTNRIRK